MKSNKEFWDYYRNHPDYFQCTKCLMWVLKEHDRCEDCCLWSWEMPEKYEGGF